MADTMKLSILLVCSGAVEAVLLGKRVKMWGYRGKVVGIDLQSATPVKVLFDTQEDPDETPWGFTYEQLEWFEEVAP